MLLVIRDDSLTVTKLGELTDMSGTNDAFNSSICSLEVISIHFLLHLSLFVCFGFEHLFHLLATNDAFDSLPYVHCSFFIFYFLYSFVYLIVRSSLVFICSYFL